MIEYIKRNDLGLTDFEIVMCDGDYKEALKMLLDKIEKAPAADVVEVIHAYWIDGNPEDLLDVRMRCSNYRTIHAPYSHWHYCPSCGRKWTEGRENETDVQRQYSATY